MYLKYKESFLDADLLFVGEFLEHLDIKLQQIMEEIDSSQDPDSSGLFDKEEYFIGVGFVIAQRYITSTYPHLNITKNNALNLGPIIKNQLTFVKALNAGANYWKHQEEWGLENIIERNFEHLSNLAKSTIETIELLTPWSDYTCSNLLSELINKQKLQLSALLPFLEEWRNDLDRNN